ncbi:S41 family peptidase [Sphaerisporangium sp. NPDC088356]|uniref:S41 family peptidase n=1 Tax=Sphaerisporangium sp. NPDC088356 TaxID=3154871 RepID=UPI003437E46B
MPARDWSAQIKTLCDHLVENYVFPDVAQRACEVLRSRLEAYAEIDDDETFAAEVTKDLQSINGDKHLRLLYSVDPIPEEGDLDSFDEAAYREEAALNGYGFARVERLAGNIGYLDTRQLFAAEVAGPFAVAAMNLVAATDVLIIDVRKNVGGDPHMIALICGYLFDKPTHLNNLYWRAEDSTGQFWSHPFVPGPRFGGSKPIYVLTSGTTFSGAEELAYDLQTRQRAVVIGERTRGGAHQGGRYRVDAHLKAGVPSGRAINPVTGTNWEGVGIIPDVETPAESAFEKAYELALGHVLSLGGDGVRRKVAQEAREALASREAPDTN